MNFVYLYAPLILQGLGVTFGVWLLTSCLSFAFGLLLGTLSGKELLQRKLFRLVQIYTFVAKGVPAYVQILIAYYVVPQLLGIQLSALSSACIALIFCSTGYMTEIVRCGINSVPSGQWEAAMVLGYSKFAMLRFVVLPQALRVVLPAIFGEIEQLLKSTSLLATIGVSELTFAGANIISRELNPLPVYAMIALIYLLFSAGLWLFKEFMAW